MKVVFVRSNAQMSGEDVTYKSNAVGEATIGQSNRNSVPTSYVIYRAKTFLLVHIHTAGKERR